MPSTKPKLLVKALAELREERPGLAAFAFDYVISGEGSQRLESLPPPDREVLARHLVQGESEARRRLAKKPFALSPEQWVRLGRLAATGYDWDADEGWPGSPPNWFCALQILRMGAVGLLEAWDPKLLSAWLAADGVDPTQAVTIITVPLFWFRWSNLITSWRRQLINSVRRDCKTEMAMTRYLAANVASIPTVVGKLHGPVRVKAVEWMTQDAHLRAALTPVLADWAIAPARALREAAANGIVQLPPALRLRALARVIDNARTDQLESIVELVGIAGPHERALIEARLARENDSDLAARFSLALQKNRMLSASEQARLVIPPAPTRKTSKLDEAFTQRLKTDLVGWAETTLREDPDPSGDRFYAEHANTVLALTSKDFDAVRAWLNGDSAQEPAWLDPFLETRIVRCMGSVPLAIGVRRALERRDDGYWYWHGDELDTGEGAECDLRLVVPAIRAVVGRKARDRYDQRFDPLECVVDLVFDENGLAHRDPDKVWPFFAENPERLAWKLEYDPFRSWTWNQGTVTALRILEMFPALPPKLVQALTDMATHEKNPHRIKAQDLLAKHIDVLAIAVPALDHVDPEVRMLAADWLARIADPEATDHLKHAFGREQDERVQAHLLGALSAMDEDISTMLTPEALRQAAKRGLKKKPPASMSWFPLDNMPECRWAQPQARATNDAQDRPSAKTVPANRAGRAASSTENRNQVDPEILKWWAVLAVKLKDPAGAGVIPRYVALLDRPSQEALGRFVLDAWLAHDSEGYPDAECREYAEANADQRLADFKSGAAHWPDYLPREALEQVTRDQVWEMLRRERARVRFGTAIKEKGLLALTSGMPGHYLADSCRRFMRTSVARRAQFEALVTAAAINDDPPAIQFVLAISRQFHQETVRNKATELAAQIARKHGWSTDELADHTIPAAGFEDDGLLHLDYGPRAFTGRITRAPKTGALTVALADRGGQAIKALPKPGLADDPDLVKAAKAQLTRSKKELTGVARDQTARLYEAMCIERAWDGATWRAVFLDHPVMRHLAAALVWRVAQAGATGTYSLVRPTEDGTVTDLHDAAVPGRHHDRVSLAHRVLVTAEEAQAWEAHLRDYEVEPLFAQFDAGPPPVAPGDDARIDDHEGWLSDSFAIRARTKKRGYRRGEAIDGPWFIEYVKDLPTAGIQVVLQFSGAAIPEEQAPAAVERLSFRGREDGGPMPLADVPPVLLAECYADYVDVAQAGAFDPGWRAKVAAG
ncbi:MAG: DUF4132 domain-containing protein [Bifidobacteriaceae bacterium]|nr:DUF4132 domain-containing protein [Bifidobacteriaceae bacterium]